MARKEKMGIIGDKKVSGQKERGHGGKGTKRQGHRRKMEQ